MTILKFGFFAIAAFISAVGIFVGCVMMLAFLSSGQISVSYLSGGVPVSETVSRAAQNERFWWLFLLIGLGPAVLGAGVLGYSVRRLRSFG